MIKVLSIESHVVHGYVGNKAATFVLQSQGIDVDPINTVHYSNHTGYKAWGGTKLSAEQFRDIMQGLMKNDLCKYDAILTGYVGSVELLKEIYAHIQSLCKSSPNTIFLCDPVIGDNGRMYVSEETAYFFRDFLVPIAHIITPNQFEFEILLRRPISSVISDIVELHRQYSQLQLLVLTSYPHADPSLLTLYASVRKSSSTFSVYSITFPRQPIELSGTGDTFAALVLGFFLQSKNSDQAVLNALNAIQHVVHITVSHSHGLSSEKKLELNLLESQKFLSYPESRYPLIDLTSSIP